MRAVNGDLLTITLPCHPCGQRWRSHRAGGVETNSSIRFHRLFEYGFGVIEDSQHLVSLVAKRCAQQVAGSLPRTSIDKHTVLGSNSKVPTETTGRNPGGPSTRQLAELWSCHGHGQRHARLRCSWERFTRSVPLHHEYVFSHPGGFHHVDFLLLDILIALLDDSRSKIESGAFYPQRTGISQPRRYAFLASNAGSPRRVTTYSRAALLNN